MNKQTIFSIIAVGVILSGVGLYYLLPDESVKSVLPTDIVFYYGDTCPHCKKVEEYVIQNNIHDQIPFVEKEVYNDAQNAKELEAVAEACGIDPMKVGVPLLWSNKSCLVGDADIIAFFQEKISVKQ